MESKDLATTMAELIEVWLGKPVMRRAITFCTKECERCGKRLDLALRSYAGEELDLCIRCRSAVFTVKKVLDTFASKGGIEKDVVFEYLKQPMWRKGLSAVLEGIALYGPRKPFVSAAPFLVVWNFTKLCNLHCIHCYENAKAKAADELNTRQAIEAVDKMADAGVAYVAMSGGEPLMRKDFFEVAERLKERQVAFSIATNGTLITAGIARKLKEADCSYAQVSVDGASPETHNHFRGANSFEKTMQGIRSLVKEGINVGISSTITKHNLEEVPELIDLAEELGVNIFMVYNFIPTGRGKEVARIDLSQRERESLLAYLASQQDKRKVKILSTAPQYSRACIANGSLSLTHFDVFGAEKELVDNVKFLADFVGGCGAARLYCALEPNGDIKPCVFIPIKIGNIKEDDFVEVWRNNSTLKKIRAREEFMENCGKCENRNVCGGCRARAYAYFGSVQACDPGCIKNREPEKQATAELKAVA